MAAEHAAETGAGARTERAGHGLAREVFDVLADRLFERAGDVALFTQAGGPFEEWCVWEAVAALMGRGSGWTVRPRSRYAEVGVTGSRDTADLLVLDPSSGEGALVELVVIHDWTRNTWIDRLDGDTEKLGRPLSPGIAPLQVMLAASLTAPIDDHPMWQRWLGMTKVWKRPTGLKRRMPLGRTGQLLLCGWILPSAA